MRKKVEPTKTTKVVENKKPITNSNDILMDLRLDIKLKNETQKKLINAIKKNDITVCVGPAGCGKTFLSCYEALNELKSNESPINRIVLVKSVTTLKSEEIGFLKGSLAEKMEPFMYSFINNFEKIIGKAKTELLKTSGFIEILPISYLRGVSVDNAYIIIDEVQNITHDNLKTILTRLGENSKMIFLGDLEQIDIKNKKESSLGFLVNKIKNNPKEGVNVIEFNDNDIVRHKLTSYFINLFKDEKTVNDRTIPVVTNNPTIKNKKNNILSEILKKIIK